MNWVMGMLTVQCLLGGFDNLWHHELQVDLPHEPGARRELSLHTAREFLYSLIFVSAAWLRWEGLWTLVFGAVLLLEILITLADFVEEDRTRLLPPLERVLHTILALSYGATLALWIPELFQWAHAPTGFRADHHGAWSWLMTLFAIGVFGWGVRDMLAVARLSVPEWQRHPLLAGSAAAPRVVLITGATGFVGRSLTRALVRRGDQVIALSRRPSRARDLFGPWVEVCGDLAALAPERRIDAIVNLAGESIAGGLWTHNRRRRLIHSRLQVTQQVVTLIERLERKPRVLVNASAIGFYGDRDEKVLNEESGPSEGFMSELCQEWEASPARAVALGVRVCRMRIGLVLGKNGGILAPLALAARFGAGAVMGTGKQWLSWIHLEDLVRMIDFAIDRSDMVGAVNAVAPCPVTQADFERTLTSVLRRPLLLRVPAIVLRTALREMADLFLISQRVLPVRATRVGFQFAHPNLVGALRDLVGPVGTLKIGAPVIFANESCAVCHFEMDRYRQSARRSGIDLAICDASSQSLQLEKFGLTEKDLRRRLFVVKADGEPCSGVDAVLTIWRTLPRYRWLAKVLAIPGLYQLSGTVYDLICVPLLSWLNAENRHV